MKYSEEEDVEELIRDVFHNRRPRDEKIDDLTEEQAYRIIEKYDNIDRVLLVFPSYLFKNKNFIMNCEKIYDINTSSFVDDSFIADIEYVLLQIKKDKNIYKKIISLYEVLPKEKEYFIPLIKKGIEYEHYESVKNIIEMILKNNDLSEYNNELYELVKNLKFINHKTNSLVYNIVKISKMNKVMKMMNHLEKDLSSTEKNKDL